MNDTRTLQFPGPAGLVIQAESSRDGTPVDWLQINGVKTPIFARYYVVDEFGTPVLDASCNWFASAGEALAVAAIYAQLLAEQCPMPDRLFHAVYLRYCALRGRMPGFILHAIRRDAAAFQRAMREFLASP